MLSPFSQAGESPRERICPSPSTARFIGRISISRVRAISGNRYSAGFIAPQPSCCSEPVFHSDTTIAAWSLRLRNSAISAAKVCATATPARVRRSGEVFQPPAMRKVNSAANRPPTKTSGRPRAPGRSMPRITPSCAPAVMPSRSGDTSGLRVISCMIAPETPRQAPTSTPAKARGSCVHHSSSPSSDGVGDSGASQASASGQGWRNTPCHSSMASSSTSPSSARPA